MSYDADNIGAPDRTIINGEFKLTEVRLIEQAPDKPGSSMLLLVDVEYPNNFHRFLVGGYWSTTGFHLTTMVETRNIPADENRHMSGHEAVLHGVGITIPSAVLKDRVQSGINAQNIGRPEQPSEVTRKRLGEFG